MFSSALAQHKVKSALWESPTRLKCESIRGHGRVWKCTYRYTVMTRRRSEQWDTAPCSPTSSEDQTWWGAQPCYSCHGRLDLQVHHITFQHHLSHLSCHRITIHIVCTLHSYTHIHMYTSIKLQCWIHDSAPDYHFEGFVRFNVKARETACAQ